MTKQAEKKVTEMFNNISTTYDLVNRVLSFQIDKVWRRKLLSHLPKCEGVHLLDIATGTGDVLLQALKNNKASRGVGLDLAEKMLIVGEKKAQKIKSDARFIVGSALDLPFEDKSFDATTISFGIRNVQNVDLALREMLRVLKPGGRALILEFSLPKNKLVRALHLFYLRSVLPKIGGLISKSQSSYTYLNQTIENFPYGDDFLNLMKTAGFESPKALSLSFGIATLYWADK